METASQASPFPELGRGHGYDALQTTDSVNNDNNNNNQTVVNMNMLASLKTKCCPSPDVHSADVSSTTVPSAIEDGTNPFDGNELEIRQQFYNRPWHSRLWMLFKRKCGVNTASAVAWVCFVNYVVFTH